VPSCLPSLGVYAAKIECFMFIAVVVVVTGVVAVTGIVAATGRDTGAGTDNVVGSFAVVVIVEVGRGALCAICAPDESG
jgi:hypothetical protein